MGALCLRMEEDLKLKNYAPATRAEYLRCAKRFTAYHRRSPAAMGEREIRDFLLALAFEHASPETLKMHVASLKFLYGTTLRRPEEIVALPWPKVPHRLPDILSGTEVDALLGAVEPLLHRAGVMTAYATPFRIPAACPPPPHAGAGGGAPARSAPLPDRLPPSRGDSGRRARPPAPWLSPGPPRGR